MIKVGSDFSGVGAFNQALMRLGIEYKEVFACDMDKYARQTFIHNYGEPEYYPKNVYEREIPSESLDIYMTSPPCQAFSLAGKRLGKEDKRGILFFNSYEFIQVNKPRYFIFENVKGLLSDDEGKTFQEWVNMLGGKSVNGVPVIFPYEDSVPYHLYYKVLNAKHHGVPQNRERVFLIGIRDDEDNNFRFPVEEQLTKRLKDVLEDEVDDKYFLSEKLMKWIDGHREKRGSSNKYPLDENDIGACMVARYGKNGAEDPYIKIKSATSKGYEEATEGDSINFSVPNSETRRGRVGKGVAQTLDTGCQQGVIINPLNGISDYGWHFEQAVYSEEGITRALKSTQGSGNKAKVLLNYKIRRLTPRECFRLMDFPDSFMDKIMNYKKHLYFQFIYSNFDINKKETLCNAKLKVVKDTQTLKNLETYVLCTTKECQRMDALMTSKQQKNLKLKNQENQLNVNFAIEVLGELEQEECATNTIKWIDCTETLCMLMKKEKNQVVKDISEIQKGSQYIEKYLKITLEENLSEEKLFITLILIKQIIKSKIYTYVKMPLNTQRYISSTIVYEKKSERLLLSHLKMEYTEQLVSDSMLYKQAGNSIVVAVLEKIINKLNLCKQQ
jgi:DNA (cytosine-5)-methyltransferase 1